jgi:hypothetical protein
LLSDCFNHNHLLSRRLISFGGRVYNEASKDGHGVLRLAEDWKALENSTVFDAVLLISGDLSPSELASNLQDSFFTALGLCPLRTRACLVSAANEFNADPAVRHVQVKAVVAHLKTKRGDEDEFTISQLDGTFDYSPLLHGHGGQQQAFSGMIVHQQQVHGVGGQFVNAQRAVHIVPGASTSGVSRGVNDVKLVSLANCASVQQQQQQPNVQVNQMDPGVMLIDMAGCSNAQPGTMMQAVETVRMDL